MKKTLFVDLALVLTTLLGCKDSSKWYLTGYDNEQFIFKHDHIRRSVLAVVPCRAIGLR